MSRLAALFKRLFGKPIPLLDTYYCDRVRKLIDEYEELRAKRVLPVPSVSSKTRSQYLLQAADILEKENRKRAPSLENEVRVLSLAVRDLLNEVKYLHDHLNRHVR